MGNRNISNFTKILNSVKYNFIKSKSSNIEIYKIITPAKELITVSAKDYNKLLKGNFKEVILTKVLNKLLPESFIDLFEIDKQQYLTYNSLNNYPFYTKNIKNIIFSKNFDLKDLELKLKSEELIPFNASLFISTNYQMFNMIFDNNIYHFSIEKIWFILNDFNYSLIKIGSKNYTIIE